MRPNPTKTREWKDGNDPATGTPALGSYFNAEFDQLYENDEYFEEQIEAVNDRIDDLIGGAPSALDTLNELAAALADDENYATTVLNRLAAASEKNLVYNAFMKYFSNKAGTTNWYDYKHPDGWVFTIDGSDGKVGYSGDNECCKMTSSSDGSSLSFKQALHEFPRWGTRLKGFKVTGKVHIKGSVNATVKLYDGVNTVTQALAGTGAVEVITLQLTVDASATGLWIEVTTATASETIEVYKAYVNVGEYAVEGLPCIIEGKIGFWAGMEDAYPVDVFEGDATEIPAGYTRLESWLNGRFGVGGSGRSKLPELQGRFMRVLANGNANDPDRASRTDRGDGTTGDKVGTKQDHQLYSHSHNYDRQDNGNNAYPGPSGNYVGDGKTTTSTTSTGGNETRPINMNILAGIKWA